jgi:hypothetical protein
MFNFKWCPMSSGACRNTVKIFSSSPNLPLFVHNEQRQLPTQVDPPPAYRDEIEVRVDPHHLALSEFWFKLLTSQSPRFKPVLILKNP